MEAAAIAYYHQEVGRPIVKVLLGDDAPQFKLITQELSLCWVHDGRHYKRLMPIVPNHQKELTTFLDSYWKFYHTLHEYKKIPLLSLQVLFLINLIYCFQQRRSTTN